MQPNASVPVIHAGSWLHVRQHAAPVAQVQAGGLVWRQPVGRVEACQCQRLQAMISKAICRNLFTFCRRMLHAEWLGITFDLCYSTWFEATASSKIRTMSDTSSNGVCMWRLRFRQP
jgi:hypothetical protein